MLPTPHNNNFYQTRDTIFFHYSDLNYSNYKYAHMRTFLILTNDCNYDKIFQTIQQ